MVVWYQVDTYSLMHRDGQIQAKNREVFQLMSAPECQSSRGIGNWSLDVSESSVGNNSEDTGEKPVRRIEFCVQFRHP